MTQQIAIVGAGMAALAMVHRLMDLVSSKKIQILLFDAASLAPNASYASTAIVARYGLQSGLSPLGDELNESYSLAFDFYEHYLGQGVERVDHWHLATPQKLSSHLQRFKDHDPVAIDELPDYVIPQENVFYEQAYMITPEVFLPRWRNELLQAHGIEFIQALVVKSDQHFVYCHDGRRFGYDRLFWCHGASGEAFMEPHLKLGKQVMGHVYRYSGVDCGAQSFVLGLDGKNAVYRAQTQELFLGGTSVETSMLPDLKTLEKQRWLFGQYTQDHLASLISSPGELQGGPRHKASKRRIATRQIQTNQYQVNGLYKNGYSSCFLAAKRARDWLKL